MPPSSNTPDLSRLSLDDCRIKFIGEGAANVVFEIAGRPGNEVANGIFKGSLLRVPKAGTKTHSHPELQAYWESTIRPLFPPENLVQQRLVKLGGGDAMIAKLNQVLEKEESRRRRDFQGSRVAAAEYGMLIEDMREKSSEDLFLEFKPKWLTQSPSAPPLSSRCRTCAREARRNHSHPSHHKSHHPKILCPLDFNTCSPSSSSSSSLSPDHSLANILSALLAPFPGVAPVPRARLCRWLQTNDLLPRLRDAQMASDALGPLGVALDDGESGSRDGQRLQLAMTLRDCSCFVRIPADASRPVEAKLADLDKKNWREKLKYWQTMERELIEGGYYEGKETPREETDCQLERAIPSLSKT